MLFNMVFIHFSDCFLCFTYVMGTLVQFTLLLCYIGSYMFPGGIGTCVFNTPCLVFTVGKSHLVVVAVQGAPLLKGLENALHSGGYRMVDDW